jgi:tetratricopeptide (TPR) repeat protein
VAVRAAPDPDRLLANAGVTAPGTVAAVLAVDQWQRWQAGERLRAEDYLARHPAVAADPACAMLLVYGEFLVREERGEAPTADEYMDRFPQYAEPLRAQFGLHAAARDDFRAALEKRPDDPMWRRHLALVLLATDDLAAFKEGVGPAGMTRLVRCTADSKAQVVANVAWLAALTPHGDAAQALPLIERAIQEQPQQFLYLNNYGLVLYRLGRYPEALEKVLAGTKTAGQEGNIRDWLVLAMAYHRMNQPEEAGRWSARVEAWFALPPEKRLNYDGRPLSWSDRLEADFLRREAEALRRPR